MQPTVRTMEHYQGGGIRVLSPGVAVTLFEQKGSGPPEEGERHANPTVGRPDERSAPAGDRNIKSARSARNRHRNSSTRPLLQLNGTKALAENVLDTCLYMVRALYDTGDTLSGPKSRPDSACASSQGATQNCKSTLQRSSSFYEEAGQPSRRRRARSPSIASPRAAMCGSMDSSSGQTPFTMTDLYPGDYQVQVECNTGRARACPSNHHRNWEH